MAIQIDRYKDLRVDENIDLEIGPRCAFNGMLIKNDGAKKGTPRAKVTIGRNFHCGKGCKIRTSDHDFRRGYPMVSGELSGMVSADVTIGDHVWFGDEVLVMKGVTIGSGVVIQARSVVVSNIPDLAIAGGHPCRPFSYRTREEYDFFRGLKLERHDREKVDEQRAFLDQALAAFRKR